MILLKKEVTFIGSQYYRYFEKRALNPYKINQARFSRFVARSFPNPIQPSQKEIWDLNGQQLIPYIYARMRELNGVYIKPLSQSHTQSQSEETFTTPPPKDTMDMPEAIELALEEQLTPPQAPDAVTEPLAHADTPVNVFKPKIQVYITKYLTRPRGYMEIIHTCMASGYKIDTIRYSIRAMVKKGSIIKEPGGKYIINPTPPIKITTR